MRYSIRLSKLAAALALAIFSAALPCVAADLKSGAPVAGSWQQHDDAFDYFGITSLYTCNGLEDQVKQILLHFGARKDLHVFANGCPRGQTAPSHFATVHARFYTLAPAEHANAAGSVVAQWTALEMTPRHPFFMGDGDCELVKEMKEFLSKNFTLRDVRYTTGCVPHDLTLNGFSVKVEALKPLPQPKLSALAR